MMYLNLEHLSLKFNKFQYKIRDCLVSMNTFTFFIKLRFETANDDLKMANYDSKMANYDYIFLCVDSLTGNQKSLLSLSRLFDRENHKWTTKSPLFLRSTESLTIDHLDPLHPQSYLQMSDDVYIHSEKCS